VLLRIDTARCLAHFQGETIPVQIGRAGPVAAVAKIEGDGKTPLGDYGLGPVYYRPDRLPGTAPRHWLPLTPDMGWCDDATAPDYNRLVHLPCAVRHEILWRAGPEYNLLAVIQYNTNPVLPHRGSAIFLHCSHDDLRLTAGCVAMAQADLTRILSGALPAITLV
jgi:L,D-peptidoglycan transpeptidase YkuD (ErfK/YbiS/YcfS/YnhG family)